MKNWLSIRGLVDKNRIIWIHDENINEFGGVLGLRDENLLDSALDAPFQEFWGYQFYPEIEQKAARLAVGIIKDHAFIDGNKRTGMQAMFLLLELNGVGIECTQKDVRDLALAIANGELDLAEVVDWIKEREK